MPFYYQCFLPVLRSPFANAPPTIPPHHIYNTLRTSGFGWDHVTYSPHQPPPHQQFAVPFQAQAAAQIPPIPPAAQQHHDQDEDEHGASNGEPPPKKKRKLFHRKEALDGELRNYAVRMFPTSDQVKELKRCFAMERKAFNFANAAYTEGRAPLNFIMLRNLWKKQPLPSWASIQDGVDQRVSTSFQSRAIKDFVDAENSNLAKRRKNPTHTWKTNFRSLRRTPTEILHVEKNYEGKRSTLLRFEKLPSTNDSARDECLVFFGNNLKNTGGIRLVDRSSRPSKNPGVIQLLLAEGSRLKEEAKIRWDKRLGTFHLIYSYVLPRKVDPDPTFQSKSIVACDPGCYPFQAWYSPTSGKHGEMLVGGTEELMRRCHVIDKLCGKLARYKGQSDSKRRRKRRRKQLRRGLARRRQQLRGWVKACHYNVANTLLREYDVVLQPCLPTARLTLTTTRNISSKTARAMLTWSHSLFVARLRSASARYAGRHVLEVSEPGTSKTCTHCGAWKADLQVRDKVYDCTRCGLRVDRQLAGARNNFLAAYGSAIGVGWDGND